MIRLLSLLAVACLIATAALGCKAKGEVDEASTNVVQAQ